MYALRPPAAPLEPYIEHYWFVSSTPEEPAHTRVDVFVDARADLIFNFEAPYLREVIGGEASPMGSANVDMQRLEPIRIVQTGHVRTTGVRFRLGGLGAFVDAPLRSWTGTTPAPSQVWGEAAATLDAALEATPDPASQAALLDAFFLERRSGGEGRRSFEAALAACASSAGRATVADVAAAAGVSGRQVARLFARHLGIAPKATLRVVRFQHALRMLMEDPGVTLATVAAEAGYFDQAHFVKDFRRMSGGVPRGYRGYYPEQGPHDFAPNVVVFLQEARERAR